MEKIDNNLKIKLLFTLLFSNLSVYMLASSPAEYTTPSSKEVFQIREGYTDFKLSAKLLTSFGPNKPVSLISQDKKLFIPFALLKAQASQNSSNPMLGASQEGSEYIVYLPERYIPQLLSTKKLTILPFGKKYSFKKRKRSRYEIHL